jgi:hypothetical protein
VTQDLLALLKGFQLPDPRQASLPVLSLWHPAKHYLMFFTLQPELFPSHYDEDAGSYLCPGAGCPACAVRVRATEHVYVPVWDVENRRVAALKFVPQGDAANRIFDFLQTHQDRLADIVAVFDGRGKGAFTITAHEALPETDRGALTCQAFADDLKAGRTSLRSCVKQLDGEAIARLGSVRHRLVPVIGPAVGPSTVSPGQPTPGQTVGTSPAPVAASAAEPAGPPSAGEVGAAPTRQKRTRKARNSATSRASDVTVPATPAETPACPTSSPATSA